MRREGGGRRERGEEKKEEKRTRKINLHSLASPWGGRGETSVSPGKKRGGVRERKEREV